MGHVTYLEILEFHEERNMLLLTFRQGISDSLQSSAALQGRRLGVASRVRGLAGQRQSLQSAADVQGHRRSRIANDSKTKQWLNWTNATQFSVVSEVEYVSLNPVVFCPWYKDPH
jgi:hypothetical protein